jgi:hypothetical protein
MKNGIRGREVAGREFLSGHADRIKKSQIQWILSYGRPIADPPEFHFLSSVVQFNTTESRAGGAVPTADGDTVKMNFLPSELTSQ